MSHSCITSSVALTIAKPHLIACGRRSLPIQLLPLDVHKVNCLADCLLCFSHSFFPSYSYSGNSSQRSQWLINAAPAFVAQQPLPAAIPSSSKSPRTYSAKPLHSTCSTPSPPLSATAIKPVPSHSHVTESFFSINDFLFLYLSIVPKRLGLSCGLHIRKHGLGSVKSRYNIVSCP